MAFDFEDEKVGVGEYIASLKRIHEKCIKLEDNFSELKRYKTDGLWGSSILQLLLSAKP